MVLTTSLLMATPDPVGTREVAPASLDLGDVVLPVEKNTARSQSESSAMSALALQLS